jgi:RNA polymerase sigma-70 factor (ECF subfamily)
MIRQHGTVLYSAPEAAPSPQAAAEAAAAMPLWDDEQPPPAGEQRGPGRDAPPAGLNRCYTDLLHYLCQLCGERQQAEDLLQDTFLLAWQRRTDFRDPQAARSWLYKVAGNLHRQQHRRDPQGSAGRIVALREDLAAAPDVPPWSDTLRRALADLSADDRQAILLVAVHGFALPDAAVLLGLSEAAVTKRWQRARVRLADGLRRWSGDMRGESRQAGAAGGKDGSR